MTAPAVTLLAWTAGLAAALAGLHAAGGPLAPPPLAEPAEWLGWAQGRPPTDGAVALARLAALALGWYLLLATLAGTAARLSGAARAVVAVDAVTLPAVRRLVHGAVGASIVAAGLSAGAAGASPAAGQVAAAVRVAVTDRGPQAEADAPVPVLRRLPDAGATAATTAPAVSPTTPTTPTTPVAPVPGPATATVRPGDHFWALAERSLAEAWGRSPSDREVDAHWRATIEANREVLRDPANPDLLFPGQVVTLPPTPSAPGERRAGHAR